MMMIAQMAMQLDQQQSINQQLIQATESNTEELRLLKANLDNTTEYFTALAFCKLNSIKASSKELNLLGRRASALSKT